LIACSQVSSTTIASQDKTFANLCRDKANLGAETRKSVELILKRIKIEECDRAAAYLSSVTKLDLSNQEASSSDTGEESGEQRQNRITLTSITDLTPLSKSTQLKSLDLSKLPISIPLQNHQTLLSGELDSSLLSCQKTIF
jgi:internalin A